MFQLSVFGAPKISLDLVDQVSKNSPNIIIWFIPFMFFFAGLEIFMSYRQHKGYYDTKETIGSTLTGLGNVGVNFLLKTVLLLFMVWIYNLLPWRMTLNWWHFIPCYILFDFCSYWAHRVSHKQRFLWATHVTHHSGEHYNLTVSFRLSWVQNIKIIFFIPVALIGFHPIIIFAVSQAAVMFQFWVHTEYIRKLPRWIEYVFATPSNHRVHHGKQDKYIDKNFAATFIIWDRMFGTYQAEEEKVEYGITQKMKKKIDPIHLNFHEYYDMWNDVKSTNSFRKKLFYIFGSPGKIAREKERLSKQNQV